MKIKIENLKVNTSKTSIEEYIIYFFKCSASCGNGIKIRNVTCHRVHHGGVIDPVPLPELYQNKIHHQNYCSVYKKPPTKAKCLVSYCGDEYMWRPEPWKEVSFTQKKYSIFIPNQKIGFNKRIHQKFF